MYPTDPARAIDTIICDVDGVLTDGRLSYGDGEGDRLHFHTQDGHAIKVAIASGLRVGICSGRSSGMVARRGTELGMDPILLGVGDKCAAIDKQGLDWSRLAFLGDDGPDLAAMRRSALGIAVADAAPAVRRRAAWVLRRRGGDGAVAEAIDRLLAMQGRDADRRSAHG